MQNPIPPNPYLNKKRDLYSREKEQYRNIIQERMDYIEQNV